MRRKMYRYGAFAIVLAGALAGAPVFAEEIEDTNGVVAEETVDSFSDSLNMPEDVKSDTVMVSENGFQDPLYVPENDPEILTGWQEVDGKMYYFDEDGVMQTGWQEIGGNWYYFDAEGVMCTGWLTLGKQTYYFQENGQMATGWVKDGGSYFYFDENGRKKTGWLGLSKGWYYLGKDGKMVTGWQQIGSKYYYFAGSGLMQTGWFKDGRGWYYFDASGRMVTGWCEIKSRYYFFNSAGLMQTGWVQSKGKYYYMDPNGRMLTGWQKLSGKWYLFKADGSRDTSIIDEDSEEYRELFAEGTGNSDLAGTATGFVRVLHTSEEVYNGNQLTTVQHIYAIEYDSGMNFMGARIIPNELTDYGGFFSGEDAYYFLFAEDNTEENDDKEVFRVVKYSKDWKRLGAAAITGDPEFGHQVRNPFSWSTLDMLEKNGKLYIASGHEGYVDDRYGMGHQGLLVMIVDENELTGYISTANLWHSFSQNLAISSDGEIFLVEESEGDEATIVSKLKDDGTYATRRVEDEDWYFYEKEVIKVLKYGGERTSAWAVATGATANDIQVTGSNVLVVGQSIDQSRYDDDSYDWSYNIYLTVTPRDNFTEEATELKWITKDNGGGYSFIRLLKLNENRLLLCWRRRDAEESVADAADTDTMKARVLHYVFLDGEGKTTSKTFTASGNLSDACPIVKDGNVIFTASDGAEVAFYTIDGKSGAFSKKLLPYKKKNMASWTVKDNVATISGSGSVDEKYYNEHRYDDFWDITTLYVEEGVTSIPDFDNMQKLAKAVIPNSVTALGDAFCEHREYLEVYVPASVTSIGEEAFYRAWYKNGYRDQYNAKIYCEKDSYAAKFAEGKGITYEILAKPYDLVSWRKAAPAKGEWKKGQYYDETGNAYGSGILSWKKNAKGWWVESSDGWYPKNEWMKIDGKWYYFDNRGYMVTGAWQDGRWLSGNGSWTYSQRGAWKCDSKGWWYDDTSGWKAKNQWQKINGNWYYFGADSYMVTGDRTIKGKVYHFGSNGVCRNP